MNTCIYDLTGKVQFSRYIDRGDSDTQMAGSEPLRDLLIVPNAQTNKQPYLQDRNQPTIEDFHQGGMRFNYDRSYFLSDILSDSMDPAKMQHLRSYFQYQNSLLESKFDNADSYIILVPDDYDSEKQEKILRNCGLRPSQTLLLWRSVAACLGAEDDLKALGAKDNDRVAVIDPQTDGRIMVSILTLTNDSGFLVPCRKAFTNDRQNYHIFRAASTNRLNADPGTLDFWKHTYNQAGKFIVPVGSHWVERTFSEPVVSCSIPSRILQGVKFRIVTGSAEIDFSGYDHDSARIIREGNRDFCAVGAGRFTVCRQNGLPTYFDECLPLIFIVQDIAEETITPVELIPGNERCKGGTEIIGVTIDKYYLEKANSQVNFLLNVGEVHANTHLKELVQEFGYESQSNQKLILHPSMIPGQGIAKVEVEAVPLLQENVLLDFLNMELAYDNGIPKTIAYLQKTLKRSYPIDIPDVEADGALWDRNGVRSFLNGGYGWDSGIFAKSRWPNKNAEGIERFQRINVFGTNPWRKLPFDDESFFDDLFRKIANGYKNTRAPYQPEDYIRLAAWTYQAGNPIFQPMVNQVLNKVRAKAQNVNVSISKQEFTLCANLLTHTQQIDFIQSFLSRCQNAIRWARQQFREIRGVDDWMRAFSEILMYNKDILKDIETSMCYLCTRYLTKILDSYIKNGKDAKYVKIIIKALLFLLKRRKYDRTFLRDIGSDEYKDIQECCERIQENFVIYGDIHGLTVSLMDFMAGKGTLEGIPAGND